MDKADRAATTPRRYADRMQPDREAVHRILDEALICHVAFLDDLDRPVALPMLHARLGDWLYLHMSSGASLALRARNAPVRVGVTATIVDGLVFAKTWLDHSLNYRSVMAHGQAEIVVDDEERHRALHAVMEHVVAGRADGAAPPSERDLAATAVLRVGLSSAAAKVRTGGPGEEHYASALPTWAGVVGLRTVYGPVEGLPDPPRHITRLLPQDEGANSTGE